MAIFDVTDADAFEKAHQAAKAGIDGVAGQRSIRMTRGIESPNRFILLIEWDSIDAHRAAGKTEAFGQWIAAISPYFDGAPRAEHFTDV
ncbi:antibiotic biosynthesis monooxygenase [Gordonia sp. X0973]|uniref:antibiotic biosynthesis monooxygenase family protein n=1 Tax=Gordonia sp. X0973 TaxID=2742602 RepID=UPI0026573255|nr:antibiotic biosynthesis monooxygenase [Gordonia sp. X0973]